VQELLPPLYPVRRVGDQDEMERLVRSIATQGLLHPLTVAEEDGRYRILAGHRRFIACRSLGWGEIPCHILQMDHRERANVTIAENLVREQVNPVDLAWYLRHLVEDEGLNQSQIAEWMGYSPARVSQLLKLTTMDDDTQAAIQSGDLSEQAAQQLYRIPNPDVRAAYTREAVTRGYSGPVVANYVEGYLHNRELIDQAVETANETRMEIHAETRPLVCYGCETPALERPGEMVWLCSRCLQAIENVKAGDSPQPD
jgi:ParB/RepB/Spo0J family partition protein